MTTMKRFLSMTIVLLVALASAFTLASVDLNSATESQLETLPGIGPKKAKDIVAERQANGPFKSVDDLRRVKGIGDKTIADLRAQVAVGSPPASASEKPVRPARDSADPAGTFPWGWVVLVVVAAGGIGWFVLRRRPAAPGASVAAMTTGESAPPTPTLATDTARSAPPPKPAGPPSPGASGAKPAASAGISPPPAPAGPKPAGQPPARPAGGGPPPAPAGPKRKDV